MDNLAVIEDAASDPLSYTVYGNRNPPRDITPAWWTDMFGDWRPNTLQISAAAGALSLMIFGGVIVNRIASLPDIDGLFEPQIVQMTPNVVAPERLTTMADAGDSANEINVAPTPPVSVDPYPATVYDASYDTSNATQPVVVAGSDAVETPAPTVNRVQTRAQTDDADLAQSLSQDSAQDSVQNSVTPSSAPPAQP